MFAAFNNKTSGKNETAEFYKEIECRFITAWTCQIWLLTLQDQKYAKSRQIYQ